MTQATTVRTNVTLSDLKAALAFVDKRVSKHEDPLLGTTAALFSVMHTTCGFMAHMGLSIERIRSMLDQTCEQVVAQIEAENQQVN